MKLESLNFITNLYFLISFNTGHSNKIFEKTVSSENIGKKELVFAQSPKGREMLIHDGHKYTLLDKAGGKQNWRCNNAKKYGCRSAASTNGNDFILIKGHNHPRENFPVQVVKMKQDNSKIQKKEA